MLRHKQHSSERGYYLPSYYRVSDSSTERTRNSFDISEMRRPRPPQDQQREASNPSRSHRFSIDEYSKHNSRQGTRHSLDDNLLRQNRTSRMSRDGGTCGPQILQPVSNTRVEKTVSLRRKAFQHLEGGRTPHSTESVDTCECCDDGPGCIKRPMVSSFDCTEAVKSSRDPESSGTSNQSTGASLWGHLKQSMRPQGLISRGDAAVSALQQCINTICDGRRQAPEKASPMYVNTSSRGVNPKLIRRSSMEKYMAVFRGINIECDGTVKPDEFVLHLERQAPGLAKHAVGMFDAMRRTSSKTGRANGDGLDFGDILHHLFPTASDREVQHMVQMVQMSKKKSVSKKKMLSMLDEAKQVFDEIHTCKSGWLSRREAEEGLGVDVTGLFGTRNTSSERNQVQFKDFFAWYSNLDEIKQHVADTAYDISE